MLDHIGSGNAKVANDRKLPTKLDPECKRSQAQGSSGSGHNQKSYREDQADFAMDVDTEGREKAQTPDPAKEGSKVSGTLPSFLGGRGGY
jgi:hypothetical protein